jgi:hypothetical protein
VLGVERRAVGVMADRQRLAPHLVVENHDQHPLAGQPVAEKRVSHSDGQMHEGRGQLSVAQFIRRRWGGLLPAPLASPVV